MKKLLTTIFGLFLFVVLVLPNGASALTITPPTYDYTLLNPGDTVVETLKLFNEGSFEETFYPIVMNFGPDKEEKGSPQFYPADEDYMGQGLADWVTISTAPVTLGPQERLSIPFTINVPSKNVTPGGHYGAIMMSTSPPTVDGGVGVASQLAAIILVNIAGEVEYAGNIAGFGFENPQTWYNHLPIDMYLRFENTGNTHLRPVGNLLIENWMGRRSATLKVNEEFKSVLPNSIRRYTFGWKKTGVNDAMSGLQKEWKNFGFGKYTADLIINYGNNQVLTDSRTFYVWPWRLMTIFGVGLIVVLIGLFIMKRSYDKSLMKKFERIKNRK